MTKDELMDRWNRRSHPRVRDAWLDREVFNSEIVLEKGQPYRVTKDQNGNSKRQLIPRWTANRILAKQLARKAGPLHLSADDPPHLMCLKVLIGHLRISEETT